MTTPLTLSRQKGWGTLLVAAAAVVLVVLIVFVLSRPSKRGAILKSASTPVEGMEQPAPAAPASRPAAASQPESDQAGAPAHRLKHPEAAAADAAPEVPDPVTPDMQVQVRSMLQETRQAVVEQPSSADAWGELGAACDAHKLYDCAETCYRRARELAPEDFRYPYLLAIVLDITGRGGGESIDLYLTAARLNPEYAPILWREGVALEKQGRLADALDAYLHSTEIDLRFPMGHRSAGQILLAMGDVETAYRHLNRARILSPRDGAVYAALAQAYRRLGQEDLAEAAAEQARRFEPVFDVPDPVRNKVRAKAVGSAVLYTRARQNIYEGRYQEAIPDLKVCEAADPDDPTLQVFLATCYRATGGLEAAKAHALRALQLKEKTMTAHLELAAVYIKQDQLEKGLEHYRRAQALEPDNERIDVWIADVLLHQGYNRDAADAFEHAVSLRPVSAKAQWMWGVALAEMGDLDGAIEHYHEAIRLDSGFANAYYSLGLALEQDGRTDEAIEAYQDAVEIAPDHLARKRLEALDIDVP